MKVIKYPQKIKTKETTLVLGGFSFIHNGHVELIKNAKNFKKPVSIMIIENPEFFNSKNLVQPLQDRLQDLANLGVDIAIVIKMTTNIASQKGIDFLTNIKEYVNAKKTISGKDFALGKNRSLSAKDIPNNIIVKSLKINNIKLSTSLLLEDLKLGNVKHIKNNTPFGYTTSSMVNTENIIKNNSLPKKATGIYAVWGEVNEILYWGYSHVNMSGTEKIFLPQLNFKNKTYKVRVYYENIIRKIFKSSDDIVNEQDIKNTILYLSK